MRKISRSTESNPLDLAGHFPKVQGESWLSQDDILEALDPSQRASVKSAFTALSGERILQPDIEYRDARRFITKEFLKHVGEKLGLDNPDPDWISRLDLAGILGKPLEDIKKEMQKAARGLKEEIMLCCDEEGAPRTYYTKKYVEKLQELLNPTQDETDLAQEEIKRPKGKPGRKKADATGGENDEADIGPTCKKAYAISLLTISENAFDALAEKLGEQKASLKTRDPKEISKAMLEKMQQHLSTVEKAVIKLGGSTIRALAKSANCKYMQAYLRASDIMSSQGGLSKYKDGLGLTWSYLPSGMVDTVKKSIHI